MFGLEPDFLNPYLLQRDDRNEWDISGIIGIGGDSKGVVVVSLSGELAQALTAQLLGGGVATDDDVVDAVGELVNIIAGNAKKGLEEYRLDISLPSIVRGPDHKIAWQQNVPIIGIPFKIPLGRFHLSIGLENIITG
ncbi:MAG: chemotaxis protein CheX [Spirochaetes bacterium]|nr:chemotaxis protein CheX [Spirochaetota bacterium]MBU0955417.1 chemotaxis protein CheX [Spirochaetota bacterium]